jgi:hypothetical protein
VSGEPSTDAASHSVLGGLLRPLFLWARQKSRVGLGVVGALPTAASGNDSSAWSQPRLLPIGLPTDANNARQADLLVIVGRLSHKLAPFLVRTHAAMARPAQVLVVNLEPGGARIPRTYASLDDVTLILPVDVLIESAHPRQDVIERALRALDARALHGDSGAVVQGTP